LKLAAGEPYARRHKGLKNRLGSAIIKLEAFMKKAQIKTPVFEGKRAYHKPVLINYGDVRTVTLDASQAGVVFDTERGEYVYKVEKGGRSSN
jgi:hypothetical protein